MQKNTKLFKIKPNQFPGFSQIEVSLNSFHSRLRKSFHTLITKAIRNQGNNKQNAPFKMTSSKSERTNWPFLLLSLASSLHEKNEVLEQYHINFLSSKTKYDHIHQA